MALVHAKEEVKMDVMELVDIIIEDNISKDKVSWIYETIHHFKNPTVLEFVEEGFRHDLMVSEITGVNRPSHKFADKIISLLSKYEQKELQLLFECALVLLNKK